MKLLHILASPRGSDSTTLRVSNAFLDCLQDNLGNIDVDVIDLYDHTLPRIVGDNIDAKYTLMVGQAIDPQQEESWGEVEALISHFTAADAYLVTVPMWNLSIPYALKYYIDCIVQPGYSFRYNEHGQVVPMVLGKKMICITSRGGDYSANSPMRPYDLQEPYLRAIFGLIGITDVEFINVEPTDVSPELREAAIERALHLAEDIAGRLDWAGNAA